MCFPAPTHDGVSPSAHFIRTLASSVRQPLSVAGTTRLSQPHSAHHHTWRHAGASRVGSRNVLAAAAAAITGYANPSPLCLARPPLPTPPTQKTPVYTGA
eukprot:GHVU01150525.1.p2 GENE.GHVU01150525.1~~GHVU01150525.1.p2  ORF type:complete len:100 (-),score=3.09 GHVU01150525.1:202-501(-)